MTDPAGDNEDEWERRDDLYFTKPSRDKEDFAHRYATEFYQQQAQRGNLPFDRLFDSGLLAESGLDPAWFSDDNQASV